MDKGILITTDYFRNYRNSLGFSNRDDVKSFFGAKDILPGIDFDYLKFLNKRLYQILDKINFIVCEDIKVKDLDNFKKEFIDKSFDILVKNQILASLNNQGRRPEQVYFSWMRGFVLANFFLKALSVIFKVDLLKINLIGDDSLKNIETFKRTPKADLEVELPSGEKIRLEIQSGFTGINDIKQHKVLEAKKIFQESGCHTIAIHFDLFNGQVAFIKLDEIRENDISWVTRQQMEGQTVFNIDQNYFVWKITESPIRYSEISFN